MDVSGNTARCTFPFHCSSARHPLDALIQVLHDLPEELAPALSDGRIAGGHCGVQADRVGEAGDTDDVNQVPPAARDQR